MSEEAKIVEHAGKVGADETENGAAGAPAVARGRTEPTNLFGLAFKVVERWGFPALVSIALGYAFWTTLQQQQVFVSKMLTDAHGVIEQNTDAMQAMTAEQSKTNVELTKIGALLEAHMDKDDRASRRR